jgi:hypothetical protein
MHVALTDLYAFALVLDAERQRLGERVDVLVRSGSISPERSVLEEQRIEIGEELEALRAAISKLRAQADPEGDRL